MNQPRSEKDISMIKEKWRTEQLSIAARVIIRSDPSPLSFPDKIPKKLERETHSQSPSPIHPRNSAYVFLPLHDINSSDQILGGVDVSFCPPATCDNRQDDQSDNGDEHDAIAVYIAYQSQKVILQNHLLFKLDVPYIPSYLAMRELRPIQKLIQTTERDLAQQKEDQEQGQERLEAQLEGQLEGEGEEHLKVGGESTDRLATLTAKFNLSIADVILVDGNGIMHERSAGIATCLGVSLNRKTIGIGKTLYCFDGLTKDKVSDGVERRVKEFLMWCRQSDDELVVGMQESQPKRDWVVMCQNSIYAGDDDYGNESRKNREDHGINLSLADLMKELSNYCKGFAVPLQGESGTIWGAALLGHGGKHNMGVGTKVPIYISIGHNVSLQEAVQICAGVSQTRIPEPVRQADLLGREWMRENTLRDKI